MAPVAETAYTLKPSFQAVFMVNVAVLEGANSPSEIQTFLPVSSTTS